AASWPRSSARAWFGWGAAASPCSSRGGCTPTSSDATAAPTHPLMRFGSGGGEFADQRAGMVEHQLRRRGIGDERVLQAMAAVPRERFVPERYRRRAYADSALPIGEGQTISQPWIVAAICEALELKGTESV